MIREPMDCGLRDKVAVVTGTSRGLGLATAKSLAAEECRVCLCARGEQRLREAASEVSAVAGDAGRVVHVVADVAHAQGVQSVIDRAAEAFGGIDILVNNVGMAGGADCSRHPMSSGRTRSTTRCCQPYARRKPRCRTCNSGAAASS